MVEIDRAGQADIPFIMATERLPGYEGLVGRWEQDRHERELADASTLISSDRSRAGRQAS